MNNNADALLNNFDEAACVSVNLMYTEFLISIQHVDRMKHENAVHLWSSKYIDRLKQRLEGTAQEYISGNRDILTIDWFQKKLMYMIRLHLQEFSQMVRYE
jgi:hypothetical protein